MRIVVAEGSRCFLTSASSIVRPTSSRTDSGWVRTTATRALLGMAGSGLKVRIGGLAYPTILTLQQAPDRRAGGSRTRGPRSGQRPPRARHGWSRRRLGCSSLGGGQACRESRTLGRAAASERRSARALGRTPWRAASQQDADLLGHLDAGGCTARVLALGSWPGLPSAGPSAAKRPASAAALELWG